jgi:hypothetical protein
MAARVRERALADAREQVNLLLKELGKATAETRAREGRIADLENQLEDQRQQLVTVIANAIAKNRASKSKPRRASQPKPRRKAAASAQNRPTKRKTLKPKRKTHGKRR